LSASGTVAGTARTAEEADVAFAFLVGAARATGAAEVFPVGALATGFFLGGGAAAASDSADAGADIITVSFANACVILFVPVAAAAFLAELASTSREKASDLPTAPVEASAACLARMAALLNSTCGVDGMAGRHFCNGGFGFWATGAITGLKTFCAAGVCGTAPEAKGRRFSCGGTLCFGRGFDGGTILP
jgi:hypothetical protein